MKHYNNILFVALTVAVFGSAMTACSDDDDYVINTSAIVTTIETGSADVTAIAATTYGTVLDLSTQSADAYVVGTVYSTQSNPTSGGTHTEGTLADGGQVVTMLSGLQSGVTYYYATYVTLQGKLTSYGEVKSFYTTDSQVGTPEAASVTATTAVLGGTLNGVSDLIADGSLTYGVKLWSDDQSSQLTYKVEGSSNSFTVLVDRLVPNHTYTYAAYMVLNGTMVVDSSVKTFTTAIGADASELDTDDYVDMGVDVQWCRFDVGASAEGQLGGLYGYGRDNTHLSASEQAYATGDINGGEYDIANQAGMGTTPTRAQWETLLAVCTAAEAEKNGVKGVELTSTINGNTLFFPKAGMRTADETVDQGLVAAYWTSTGNADYTTHAMAYTLSGDGGSLESAPNYMGLCVRPVRKVVSAGLTIDSSKTLVFGDLEDNGRLRIEIYNEYGSSGSNADMQQIDVSKIAFEQTMEVTFTLSGVTDNLGNDAVGQYKAGLQFAANNWWPGRWSGYSNEKYDCLVNGDGTYTVWMETDSEANGAVVFCVDIDGLGADIVDWDKVEVTLDAITFDSATPAYKSIEPYNSAVIFVNKDGDQVNGRIEIYNEYGSTPSLGADYSWMSFGMGTMTIEFAIEGIDGNLTSSASNNYTADISYATSSWWPSYWGGGVGTAAVTGDGTYNVQCWLEAQCDGAVVWTIEIYNLWQDLVDPDKVSVTINSINVPN